MAGPRTPWACSPKAMFSFTVSWLNRANVWNTNPKRRLPTGVRVMSSPSTSTRPSSADSSPAMMRSSVVLPEPDGPSSVVTPPEGASKLASNTAGVPFRVKRLVSLSTMTFTASPHDCSCRCSTSFFTTRVTIASSVSSEATAKAPTKSYSL